MTKEEAINNIKDSLKKMMSFGKAVELAFADITLADGSKLGMDEGAAVEVGSNVYVMDDQGNATPCEDGIYELEDGRSITVVGGYIDTISEAKNAAKAAGEETPQNPASTEMAMEPAPAEEAIAEGETPEEETTEDDMASRVDAIEAQIAQILEILQGMSNMQEQTMSKVQEFAASPAEESVKTKKTTSDTWTKVKATYNANKNEIDELKELMKKNDSSNYNSFSIGN